MYQTKVFPTGYWLETQWPPGGFENTTQNVFITYRPVSPAASRFCRAVRSPDPSGVVSTRTDDRTVAVRTNGDKTPGDGLQV
jgi:hypothetical protein